MLRRRLPGRPSATTSRRESSWRRASKLGAAAAGVELWRGHNKSGARAAACRLGVVEIEGELARYYNCAAAYGGIGDDQRQALLSERLTAINRAADEQVR